MKAVFFDMNETLLNLSVLKEEFDKYFDNKYAVKYWFAKLLHSSTIMGVMEEYKNFGEIADVALENLVFENNILLSKETKTEILSAFRRLPAYSDVQPALTLLKENNTRVVAVSNSSLAMIEEQLTNAGIIDLFDTYYSVDAVKKYKPFSDIYLYAAKQEALPVEDIVMIATHDWDLFGAKKAGLETAFVRRKTEIYNSYYYGADYTGTDLKELIKQIIKD